MFGPGALRGRVAALAAVIVCLLAAGTWIALTHAPAQAAGGADSGQGGGAGHNQADPLRVLSVTPAPGATGVNGAAVLRVVFSAPLAADSPLPTLRPASAGSWRRGPANTISFAPAQGFAEDEHFRLLIPGGSAGVRSAGGGLLASSRTVGFRTARYSTVRLDQLLAQLGYLPLTWTPAVPGSEPAAADAAAQRSAAVAPPAGTFSWRPGYPAGLRAFWNGGGSGSLIVTGAVMAFEADHGLTLDSAAGPQVWNRLLAAVAAGQSNSHGYTYAVASQASPETLTIWHDGQVVLRSPANTGIPVAPTTIGTAPVYLRYRFQIMQGTNPDGSHYADPVQFVAYFRAGEAVHYFPRYSYGYQQSLGCVELPWAAAAQAWPYLTYGSLVTVTAP